MRKVLIAVLVLGIALVALCNPPPYEERVHGTIAHGGAPLAGVRVRFKVTDPDDNGCAASPPTDGQGDSENVTDGQGRFQILHTYPRYWLERIDVVIHQYRLCVAEDNAWRPVWSVLNGPAPKELEFGCDLDQLPSCTVLWEGERSTEEYRPR